MRRTRVLVAVLVAVAALPLAACGKDELPSPVEQVAELLDAQLIPQKRLAHSKDMPSTPTIEQITTYFNVVNEGGMNRWQEYLKAVDPLAPWPAVTMELIPPGGEKVFQTNCPQRNIIDGKSGNNIVDPDKSAPFFCAKDGTSTLSVPLGWVQQLWNAAGQRPGTSAGLVQDAAYVWLTAQWGDAFMLQIAALATRVPGFSLPNQDDFGNAGKVFGTCIAGTLGNSVGFNPSVAVSSLNTMSSPDTSEQREALRLGLKFGRPGDCVRELWPKA